MDKNVIEELGKIVGENYVITRKEQMLNYLTDETPPAVRPKPADDLTLVKPANTQEVSDIMRIANNYHTPVYPRGGGTGLVGGAVPTSNGIILSMERLDKIEVDKDNMMAIAEAGVTLESLATAANAAGFSFPPHPGDENAQVGGLVATNAGGSRAVRHGVMRNQVRAIEVVLPTGGIMNLGGRVHKNNVGYDLMQLLIGSEGTLGVITKATLRLYPKSEATLTLIVPFDKRRDAFSVVSKILQNASTPLAVEFVEKDLVERTAKYLGTNWPVTAGTFYLIIIMAEADNDRVLSESLKVAEICSKATHYETFVAEPKRDQDNILRIRSNIYTVLKNETLDILDITVPPAALEKVVESIEQIASARDTYLPVYGHAADGNLHIHIMKNQEAIADAVRDEIYEIATRTGGVITGEHGIGKTRASKLPKFVSSDELELMRKIKAAFDPNKILNPGTKIQA
ncbi:MAG: FAD-binding oxidoreductase [Candidatus Bathyarchaeia archaeon]